MEVVMWQPLRGGAGVAWKRNKKSSLVSFAVGKLAFRQRATADRIETKD